MQGMMKKRPEMLKMRPQDKFGGNLESKGFLIALCLLSSRHLPGPWAPPFLILPSLKITALSYSWTTYVQNSMIEPLLTKRCCYLDTHEEGDGEGDDDQEERDDGQKH